MSVSFRVVEIDQSGWRVYPSEGEPWDKELSESIVLVARAAYAFAKQVRAGRISVKLDWPGGTAVVGLADGKVRAIIVEDERSPPASFAGSVGSVTA